MFIQLKADRKMYIQGEIAAMFLLSSWYSLGLCHEWFNLHGLNWAERNTKQEKSCPMFDSNRYLPLTKKKHLQLRQEIWYPQLIKMYPLYTCIVYLYHVVELEKYFVMYCSDITFASILKFDQYRSLLTVKC